MVLHEILRAFQLHVNGTSSAGDQLFEAEGLNIFPESLHLYNRHFSEAISHLAYIHAFIDKVEQTQYKPQNEKETEVSFGLYKQAFCCGVKDALRSYNYLFLEIEELILSDEDFSVISLATKLEPIVCISGAIKEAISELESKDVVGCQVLDVCDTHYRLGSLDVGRAFKTIYKTCLKPFIMQMNFWLLHAELYDPFNEFFITSDDNLQQTHSADTCSLASSSVSSLDDIELTKPVYFKLAIEKLPSFLPYSVAKKILFIGESLLMCQKDGNSANSLDEGEREEMLNECGLNQFEVLNKMKVFEDAETLNIDSFDAFISEIYDGVNKFAKKLATDVADVQGQVYMMRDLFLLGRGELFQEFILRANEHLDRPAHKVKIPLLKHSFEDAFYYVYLSNESYILDSVRFSLPGKDFVPPEARTLDFLELDVTVRWPLATIFPHEVLSSFKKMFRFLMKLKKAQITLSKSWLELKTVNGKRTYKRIASLQNQLNAFVGMLQNYCATDVIELEVQQLTRSIYDSSTYTEIADSVKIFQKTIAEQLFLDFGNAVDYIPSTETTESTGISQKSVASLSKTKSALGRSTLVDEIRIIRGSSVDMNIAVHKVFGDIFDCCHRFGAFVSDLPNGDESEIEGIELKSRNAIQTLFALSNAYNNCRDLHDLVFRLDFNNFFRNAFVAS